MKTLATIAVTLLACCSFFFLTSASRSVPPAQTASAGPLLFYWTVETKQGSVREFSRTLHAAKRYLDEHYADDYTVSAYQESIGGTGGARLHWFGACKDRAKFGEIKERVDADADFQAILEGFQTTTVPATEFTSLLAPIATGTLDSPRAFRLWRTMRVTNTGTAQSFAKQLTDYINAKYDNIVISSYRQLLGDPSIMHFHAEFATLADWQALDAAFAKDPQFEVYFTQADGAFDEERTRDVLLERVF